MTLVGLPADQGRPQQSTRRAQRGLPALVAYALLGVVVAAAALLAFFPTGTDDAEAVPSALLLSLGEPGDQPWTLDPYRGLGAWVDVFDYDPATQPTQGSAPPLDPAQASSVHAAGSRTLFLQLARTGGSGNLVDRGVLADWLAEADDAGLEVVGWYAPSLVDVEADIARLRAMLDLEVDGRRLDGLAVAFEITDVIDPDDRSDRARQLATALGEAAGDAPLGAIVLPPPLLEDVNPELWPHFPWADLSTTFDVWLPMVSWTFREGDLADPGVFAHRTVQRLEALVGPDAQVHVIGGVAHSVDAGDLDAFVEAIRDIQPWGASVYDHASTSTGDRASLRHGLPDETWSTAGFSD